MSRGGARNKKESLTGFEPMNKDFPQVLWALRELPRNCSRVKYICQHNEVKLIWCQLTFWWRLLRSMGLLWLWLGGLLLLLLLLLLWMMVFLCLLLLKVFLSRGRLCWRLSYFLFDFRLFFRRFIILIHSWAFLSPLIRFFRFNLTKYNKFIHTIIPANWL